MTDREDVLILYIPAKRLVSRSQWYAMRTAQDVHHIFFALGPCTVMSGLRVSVLRLDDGLLPQDDRLTVLSGTNVALNSPASGYSGEPSIRHTGEARHR